MNSRTPFLILGTYRTGSSALVHALNRHPQIACGLEWTQRLTPWRALQMGKSALDGDLNALRTRHRAQMSGVNLGEKSALGYKRLFRASDKWILSPALGPLLIDGLEMHLRWLRESPEIRIIHIIRNDNLDWLRSKAFADATGRYTGAVYPDDLEVRMAPREAVKRVMAKTFVDSRIQSLRTSNRYLRIDYEEFAKDNARLTQIMVEHLGLPSESLMPKTEDAPRQAKSHHRISNHKEIEHALRRYGLD